MLRCAAESYSLHYNIAAILSLLEALQLVKGSIWNADPKLLYAQ